jgi:hypothetical protein
MSEKSNREALTPGEGNHNFNFELGWDFRHTFHFSLKIHIY